MTQYKKKILSDVFRENVFWLKELRFALFKVKYLSQIQLSI